MQQQNALDSSKNNNKVPSSPKGKKGAPKTKSTMSNGGTPSIEDFQLPKYFPYFKGFHTISSISKAICTCSTIFSKKQLFFYINELASQSNSIVCQMPIYFIIGIFGDYCILILLGRSKIKTA